MVLYVGSWLEWELYCCSDAPIPETEVSRHCEVSASSDGGMEAGFWKVVLLHI